jgi:hypothetical protein
MQDSQGPPASGLFYFPLYHACQTENAMLGLDEALKWVQIGVCIAVGYYIVRGAGWLIFFAAEWLSG